jgi:hypothetical protein
MPKPENNVLMRDAQDWLRELRGLQAQALARRDFVQAEELRAEIAEVTACLDGVLESAQERSPLPERADRSLSTVRENGAPEWSRTTTPFGTRT